MESYKTALKEFFTGEIHDTEEVLETYSTDASLFRVRPQLVVAPSDAHDLAKLITFVASERGRGREISLTARGAGTDMTGGPLGEHIIVDMKNFDRIISVNENEAVAEPGVYFRDLDRATQKLDRFMPSYPASRDLCTIGGMVANNSGGEKTLRYGKTADYVKALKVILYDGKEYSITPLTLEELEEKKALETFEGKFYREMHELVSRSQAQLQQAKPDVTKNSAGYALCDVLDEADGVFDLTQLFVGSQGTLGFITEITLALKKPERQSRLLVIFLRDMNRLSDLVRTIRACGPESFESYDDHTFKIAITLFPRIVKSLGGNIFMLGIRFFPEFWAVLTGGVPKLVLLAEFTAETADEATQKAYQAQESIAAFKLKTRVTKSAADAEKYWTVRRESFNLLRQRVSNLRTAPFIEDLAVNPEVLPKFLPELYALLDEYPLTYTIAGHVGDGNFHIIPLMDLSKTRSIEIIKELTDRAHALVWKYNGTTTGEHNDGILRTPYLKDMYGPEVYSLFVATKQLFDPQEIFNPHKKIIDGDTFAGTHIDRRA